MVKHREAFVFCLRDAQLEQLQLSIMLNINSKLVNQYFLNIYIIDIYVIIGMK